MSETPAGEHSADYGLVTVEPAESCPVAPSLRSQWRNGPHWHAVWPEGEHWCYPTETQAAERAVEVNRLRCTGSGGAVYTYEGPQFGAHIVEEPCEKCDGFHERLIASAETAEGSSDE